MITPNGSFNGIRQHNTRISNTFSLCHGLQNSRIHPKDIFFSSYKLKHNQVITFFVLVRLLASAINLVLILSCFLSHIFINLQHTQSYKKSCYFISFLFTMYLRFYCVHIFLLLLLDPDGYISIYELYVS